MPESDAEGGRFGGRPGLQLSRERLAALAKPAPLALMACTLFEWAVVFASAIVAELAAAWWATALAIVVIGSRQHALLMLMHEFSHRQLSRGWVTLNDTIGDVFTALPLGITVYGFRRNHLAHHKAPSTEMDPNWMSSIRLPRYRFPMSRPRMALILFAHCIGLYAVQDVKGYLFDGKMAVETPRATKIRQLLFYGGLVGLAYALDLWLVILVYWLVPMFTVLMALLYLRDVGEHFAMPSRGHEAARTVIPGLLESWWIAPYAVGYHAEHHLYPAVPFCRLKQLHAELRVLPAYRSAAVVTRGYFKGLLREVAAHVPAPDTAH